MKELWVEKYRPKTIDEYVLRDEQQKKQVPMDKRENYSFIV